jgi:hypothetical protein
MLYEVTKRPTTIFGLKYEPSIAPKYSDAADSIPEMYALISPEPVSHFTDLDQNVLRDASLGAKVIVEIGVHAPHGEPHLSSTQVLNYNKDPDAVYIGLDKDMNELKHRTVMGMAANVHLILGDSRDRYKVYSVMDGLGLDTIDCLFIDGYHSVDQVINDWRYVERLSPDGVVAMHDTNVHPGPVTIYDAIDEKYFDKRKYGGGQRDWGISVFRRKT